MSDIQRIDAWIDAVEHELYENILSFWINHGLNDETGGFVGRMHNDRTLEKEAPQGLILNSRLLWTFAAAFRTTQKQEYAQMARRAFTHLTSHFYDAQHKGYFWMIDAMNQPVDPRKKIYGQAFTLYALSEYYRIEPGEEILTQAIDLFELIETHSYDAENLGYFEAYERDWSLAGDLRLSDVDMNEKKSMNTHLHILEAYTNLYRIWPDVHLKQRIEGLLTVFDKHIIDADSLHFKLFFDENWVSKTRRISYGHDIEGTWLLYEAAEVLGDAAWQEKMAETAIQMAEAVLQKGLQSDGALVYEEDPGKHIDTDRHWWPQAEAAVGFMNAYQLSGKEIYFESSIREWDYIRKYLVDTEKGEWYWRTNEQGRPYLQDLKVSEWKGPYHNARACMELIQRLHDVKKAE